MKQCFWEHAHKYQCIPFEYLLRYNYDEDESQPNLRVVMFCNRVKLFQMKKKGRKQTKIKDISVFKYGGGESILQVKMDIISRVR